MSYTRRQMVASTLILPLVSGCNHSVVHPASSSLVSYNDVVTKNFIPKDKSNRPGDFLNPTHITIHNTSNTDRGADAAAHARLLNNTGYYIYNGKRVPISWHYTVDDGKIIQHLPLDEVGYHARSGNNYSLGIEICMNRGIDQKRANSKAARLTASLLNQLNLPETNVVKHQFWTKKKCPTLLLEDKNWNLFKSQIKHVLNIIAPGEREIDKHAPPIIDPNSTEFEVREELVKMPKEYLSQ